MAYAAILFAPALLLRMRGGRSPVTLALLTAAGLGLSLLELLDRERRCEGITCSMLEKDRTRGASEEAWLLEKLGKLFKLSWGLSTCCFGTSCMRRAAAAFRSFNSWRLRYPAAVKSSRSISYSTSRRLSNRSSMVQT